MNVREINPGTLETLVHYVEVAVGLTVLTSWLAIALQTESSFHPQGCNTWNRVLWPAFYAYDLISTTIRQGLELTERRQVSVFSIYVTVKAHGEYDWI